MDGRFSVGLDAVTCTQHMACAWCSPPFPTRNLHADVLVVRPSMMVKDFDLQPGTQFALVGRRR